MPRNRRRPFPRWSQALRAIVLVLSVAAGHTALAAGGVPAPRNTLVPAPANWQARPGDYAMPAQPRIVVHAGKGATSSGRAELQRTAQLLAAALGRARSVHPRVEAQGRADIALVLDAAAAGRGDEAYVLDIGAGGVRITSRTPHGVFNGAMSLLQLATSAPGAGAPVLAAQHVEDAPRFAWRGLMLDSARHMQSTGDIRAYLDAMALHKLSVLQWHLTDDQGWRLQIRKYPRLTEVGGWRQPAGVAGFDADGKPARYGGFYTQDEVRAIVAYAAARYITVVPEIDLPGHAQAAIAAYPALGVVPAAAPSHDWGINDYVFNADEATFRFLGDVLDEVVALFPSRFVHIGGDEVVTAQWAASPQVRARMAALGVADVSKLQAVFTARMQAHLAAKGRRIIGWDEILHAPLPGDAAVMSWQGVKGAELAATSGHDTVLAPWPTLYLDNRQADLADEPPGRLRVVSLEDVYRFDPMPAGIPPTAAHHVLGLQAAVWTEHIRTMPRVDWMSFPRAAAVAETGWSAPARRDWNDFTRRLPGLFASYDALGIRHADSVFAVRATPSYDLAASRAIVTLASQAANGDIRFTTDGSEPGAGSPAYDAALSLPMAGVLKAARFQGAQRLSRTTTVALDAVAARTRRGAELARCSDGIALGLEDDAPPGDVRAVLHIDIGNPCWIFRAAPLDGVTAIAADVGSVPFNFQIGADAAKIHFLAPATPAGELVVQRDGCDGPEIARIPLAPATANAAITALPAFPIAAQAGTHDLCLRFSQSRLDPEWALDRIRLVTAP